MEKLGLFWKKTNIVLTRYKANWYSIFLLFVMLFGQVVKHFLTFTVYWKGCRQMFINFVSRNISKCYPNKKCNTNSWFHLLSWDVRWHLNSWLWYLLITSLLTFPFHFAKICGWYHGNHENCIQRKKKNLHKEYSMIICLRQYYDLLVLSHS